LKQDHRREELSILNDDHRGSLVDRQARPSRAARSIVVALLALLAATPATPTAATIEADTELATAGYYQLRWTAATADVQVEVSEPDSDDWRIIYSGPDRARVVSGQTDGTRVYRVRGIGATEPSAWSAPVRVTVVHHSLQRALLFFGVGAVVFLATLALIVRGARSGG